LASYAALGDVEVESVEVESVEVESVVVESSEVEVESAEVEVESVEVESAVAWVGSEYTGVYTGGYIEAVSELEWVGEYEVVYYMVERVEIEVG